jgi:hypothetical protein
MNVHLPHLPNAMHPISEIAIVGLSLIGVTASPMLLADNPPAQQFALQWLLLPLLGSLLASVAAMMFNPNPEARKTVLARCVFAVTFGTGVPKVLSMVHPAIREWSLDPVFTFLSGFVVATLVYVCARPLVEKLFARSGEYADHAIDIVERKVEQTTLTKTTETTTPNGR